VGVEMGMPLGWHKRHAVMLASQLPEDSDDARMVLEALRELLDTFLVEGPETAPDLTSNVLPFVSG